MTRLATPFHIFALLTAGCSSTPTTYIDTSTFQDVPILTEPQAERILEQISSLTPESPRCLLDTRANSIRASGGIFVPWDTRRAPYSDWDGFLMASGDSDQGFRAIIASRSFGVNSACGLELETATYDDINALLGSFRALNIGVSTSSWAENRLSASDIRNRPPPPAAAQRSGLGIGRAIAGVATGAVMADAVIHGADPEDVAQLGGQVIDIIEGNNTTAPATQDSGFQGFELPDENRREVFSEPPPVARVTQSAGGGQCDFPWMLDDSPPPTDITAIRLSWCHASDTSTLHLRANAAATQQCQLAYWKQDGRPAADIDGLSRTIRQACAYANELSDGACRCPDWYGQ